MQLFNLNPLLIIAILASLGWSFIAYSAPMGEEVGVCYAFKGDKLKSHKPCVISYGYGAGGSYTTLTFNDKTYSFEYTNEDEPKISYYRNLFYHRIQYNELSDNDFDEDRYLTCFYHKPYDICYKF